MCIYIIDIFRIPLIKIEGNQHYQTRTLNPAFVEILKDAMLEELSLDNLVYVACETNPVDDRNTLKEDAKYYILGGTHYL